MSIRLMSIATIGAYVLSGCAALEPEVCTSDWVKWRTDQITSDFRRTYGGEMRDLARFSRQLEDPSPLVLLQMTSRLTSFRNMAEDFSANVMPDLRDAVDQCGTPTKFVGAFSGLLAEQGVDRSVLDWVESTAVLIESNLPDTE